MDVTRVVGDYALEGLADEGGFFCSVVCSSGFQSGLPSASSGLPGLPSGLKMQARRRQMRFERL